MLSNLLLSILLSHELKHYSKESQLSFKMIFSLFLMLGASQTQLNIIGTGEYSILRASAFLDMLVAPMSWKQFTYTLKINRWLQESYLKEHFVWSFAYMC